MNSPPPVNPNDLGRGPMIMGITWTFTTIAMIVVALRFHVRIKLSKHCASEDWIMLVALLLVVLHQAIVSVSYHYGMGKHDSDIEHPTQFVNVLKWICISAPFGMLTSILARISIAILLVRLFGIHRWFKWLIIVLTITQTVICSLIIIFTFAQVSPVERLWNVDLPNIQQWDPKVVLYMEDLGQSLYTLSDIVYVFPPVFIVWKLHMPTRRKIGLIAMLAGSLITAGTSIAKTVFVGKGGPEHTLDVQYYNSLGVIYAIVEEDFVIIMGCIPTLHSITKLDFPILNYLGSSLSDILRGSWSGRSTEISYDIPGAYHDLETNSYRPRQVMVAKWPIVDGNRVAQTCEGSSDGLVLEGSPRVLRTDEFSVSYSPYGNTTRK